MGQNDAASVGLGSGKGSAASDGRLLVAPVFIFCSVRSGSTLLRAILGSHSMLYAPPEIHLADMRVRLESQWAGMSAAALDLTGTQIQYLLWDRVLHYALQRSAKTAIVVKTPGNVMMWRRIAECWPDARFIFLLRHPAASVSSWHRHARESLPGPDAGLGSAVRKVTRYVTAVEEARRALSGHTVRYEDLTSDPEPVTRQLCAFLGLPWEPGMLEYGCFGHDGFTPGLGDWSENIHSGRIHAPSELPEPAAIPTEIRDIARTWGYLT